jgi:retron-type reverse transcriptase
MKKNFQDINVSFDQITDIKNIRLAYFDFVKKFDEDIKSKKYRGVDGLTLNSLDFSSEELFKEIQAEMKSFREISPAYLVNIPKKSGKNRRIFVYPVKERIKAEAVYRVIQPFFDRYLSDYLFSYRSSHPSYFAARSTVRRYKRYYGENYVFVTDVADYTDSIDHSVLLKKLESLGLDKGIRKLLELFIKVGVHINGNLVKESRGIITGIPIGGVLANFFLDDFDKWAGKSVAFYRRVGDDIIAMDKDIKKINEIRSGFIETMKSLKLSANEDKSTIIRDIEPFKFLGYRFSDGLIGFDTGSIKRAKNKWNGDLKMIRGKDGDARIKSLVRLSRNKIISPNYEFERIMSQKILVDDTKQIKSFSNSLISSLTSSLFGYSNSNKKHLAMGVLKSMNTDTLFKQYQQIHNRRKN